MDAGDGNRHAMCYDAQKGGTLEERVLARTACIWALQFDFVPTFLGPCRCALEQNLTEVEKHIPHPRTKLFPLQKFGQGRRKIEMSGISCCIGRLVCTTWWCIRRQSPIVRLFQLILDYTVTMQRSSSAQPPFVNIFANGICRSTLTELAEFELKLADEARRWFSESVLMYRLYIFRRFRVAYRSLYEIIYSDYLARWPPRNRN